MFININVFGYLIPMLLLLSSCFNLPVKSSGSISVLNNEARPALAKVLSEGKAVSAYDPSSKVEMTIQPPSGALSGSRISLPAGALAIAVDLVVEESVPMSETSVASSLNLRQDIEIKPVGAGLIIRPSANVDLTKPLTIAMPIDPSAGLKAWLKSHWLTANGDYYAVFYKSMINGELRAGVIPTSELRFSDDNQAVFEGYFGAFWLCKVSAPIEERVEVHTDEPTVNANHVSVIESTGIVSEETIAAKASIPEVEWSAVSLSYDADLRTGQLKAAIGAGRSLTSCQVDLRASALESSGTNDVTDTSLAYTFPISKKEAHTLVGRFRCLDDQGRMSISDWSPLLQVPAEPDPAVATQIAINAGKAYTTSTKVTLSLAATGAKAMYITETANCTSDGAWEDYNTERTWTLKQSNSRATIYAKFRNSLGKESSCISSSIVHDDLAPSAGVLVINGGSSATNSVNVTLTLAATGATDMYVTNTAGCAANGSWETYASSKSWVLGKTNAQADVYAKFRDLAGNESTCISASIVHDSLPPTATSVTINAGSSSTSTTAVALTLSATQATEMYITNTPACASGGTWETYATNKAWTLAQSSGTANVYAKFRDQAGNVSTACVTDSITVQQATASVQVITGGYHSCAILPGGVVKCWGYNSQGQLGLGHTNTIGDNPSEMGSNLPAVDLGTGLTAVALAAGEQHTCAILNTGAVKCWGYNGMGQLGLGHYNTIGDGPNEMGDNLPTVNLGSGLTAKQITANYHHTCVVLNTNQIKCWGYNPWGQLGYGDAAFRGGSPSDMGDSLPTVNLGTGHSAKQVSAGFYYTCARLENDSVKCWGHNGQGMLGRGDTAQIGDEPNEMGDVNVGVNLGSGRTAKSISTGERFVCALLDNNTVKCWGYSPQGQLGLDTGVNGYVGDEPNEMGDSLVAVNPGSGRSVTQITTGILHACAILDNGSVKCWGYSGHGELGLGSYDNRGDAPSEMGDNLPAVDLGTNQTALAITSQAYHTCAVLNDSSIKCWGYNPYGGLGQGNNLDLGSAAGQMGDNLPALNFSSPFTTSGMKLWLRADTGLFQDAAATTPAAATSDPIAVWRDRSGSGGHMTVAATLNQTTARPLLNLTAVNGQPAVTFNGSSNLQNLVSYNNPNTIFILGRYTGAGAQGRILSGSGNNWLLGWYSGKPNAFFAVEDWVSLPSGTAGYGWEVYASDQTSTSQRLYHNNSFMASNTMASASGPSGLSLGGWSFGIPEWSACEIAEVIVYNRVLSDAERIEVNNYLNLRYFYAN